MTSVRGRGRPCREYPSVTPSVAPSIAPLDSSLPLESDKELSDQPAKPSGTKPPVADAPVAITNVHKYSENDLQRIFKTVLEA